MESKDPIELPQRCEKVGARDSASVVPLSNMKHGTLLTVHTRTHCPTQTHMHTLANPNIESLGHVQYSASNSDDAYYAAHTNKTTTCPTRGFSEHWHSRLDVASKRRHRLSPCSPSPVQACCLVLPYWCSLLPRPSICHHGRAQARTCGARSQEGQRQDDQGIGG